MPSVLRQPRDLTPPAAADRFDSLSFLLAFAATLATRAGVPGPDAPAPRVLFAGRAIRGEAGPAAYASLHVAGGSQMRPSILEDVRLHLTTFGPAEGPALDLADRIVAALMAADGRPAGNYVVEREDARYLIAGCSRPTRPHVGGVDDATGEPFAVSDFVVRAKRL